MGEVKSLLITSYFPPQTGGISHFMRELALALGRSRVCCLASRDLCHSDFAGDSAPRVYYSVGGAKRNYMRALEMSATIGRIILRERPKAVQLATVSDGALGLWLNRWFQLPFVVYAHGNEILNASRGDRNSSSVMALKKAARVFAVSRFTAGLVQELGIAPNRIEIVHPGCEADRFQPRQPRKDVRDKLLGDRNAERLILTVGSLVERKGHDTVIRALPFLNESVSGVTYLIVGTGPNRSRLETLARELGVRDQVVFAGQVAAQDLPDVYALSDVFAMPSRERVEASDVEGFGLVFLEASACGKPIVGSWSGGVPDAVVDGFSGLLVDAQQPEEIARALSRLLRDPNLAKQLGEQGRARVTADLSWERVAERVQGIMETVALHKKTPLLTQEGTRVTCK